MKNYFIWLLKLLTLIGIFLFVVPVLIVSVTTLTQTDSASPVADGNKTVGVVELTGLIDSSKAVLEELYKQAKNDKIKGIVLRVDTPGGAVGPSQEIYSAVKKLKEIKPIVVSMGAVAASGGLYASLGASKIFCQPGTLTGSIGVILQIPNFTKLSQTVGVEMITIKSGELKDAGNSFRPMTDSEREFLSVTTHSAHEQFMAAVVEGRGLKLEDVRSFADGRVILGGDALKLKLVDDFGDVYDAGRAVFDILGIPLKAGEYPKLYYPSERFKQLKALLDNTLKLPRMMSQGFELKYVMY
jgi:protease IV